MPEVAANCSPVQPSSFGARLRIARDAIGLTQHALAEKSGCRPNSVCRWEKDRQKPDLETASTLADVLGVSLDWLSRGVGDGPAAVDAHAEGADAAE